MCGEFNLWPVAFQDTQCFVIAVHKGSGQHCQGKELLAVNLNTKNQQTFAFLLGHDALEKAACYWSLTWPCRRRSWSILPVNSHLRSIPAQMSKTRGSQTCYLLFK